MKCFNSLRRALRAQQRNSPSFDATHLELLGSASTATTLSDSKDIPTSSGNQQDTAEDLKYDYRREFTKILKEFNIAYLVKDILDELHMIKRVFETQQEVINSYTLERMPQDLPKDDIEQWRKLAASSVTANLNRIESLEESGKSILSNVCK